MLSAALGSELADFDLSLCVPPLSVNLIGLRLSGTVFVRS